MNRDQFLKRIDSFNDELVNLRRHIHAHPELSGLENQTAILISGYLKDIGWKVRESIGRTGVIADFGPLEKGIIGLRVDMDALPIMEETNLCFSSKIGKASISTLMPMIPLSKGPKSAITPVLPTDSVTFQPISFK